MKSFFQRMGPLCITALLFACGDGSEFANIDQHAQGSLYGTPAFSSTDGEKFPVAPECLLSGPKSIHLEAKVKTSATKEVSFSNMGSGACEVENVYLLLPPGTSAKSNPFSVRAYVGGIALTNSNVASVNNNKFTEIKSGDSLDVVISYTPQHDMGKDSAHLRININNFFIEPIAISAEVTQADVTSITTGRTCDDGLACVQTITCCAGELYPTGCCSDNCDTPIGQCDSEEDTPLPGCQLGIYYGDATTNHSGVIDFGQVEQGDVPEYASITLENTGNENCTVNLNILDAIIIQPPELPPGPPPPFLLVEDGANPQPSTSLSLTIPATKTTLPPANVHVLLDTAQIGEFHRTLSISTSGPDQYYPGTPSCPNCLWENIELKAHVVAAEDDEALGCILEGLPRTGILNFGTGLQEELTLVNDGDEPCELSLLIVNADAGTGANLPHFSFAEHDVTVQVSVPPNNFGSGADPVFDGPVLVPLFVNPPAYGDYSYEGALHIFAGPPPTTTDSGEVLASITLKAHGNDNDNDDMMAPPNQPW